MSFLKINVDSEESGGLHLSLKTLYTFISS